MHTQASVEKSVRSAITPGELSLYIQEFGSIAVTTAIAGTPDYKERVWLLRLLDVSSGALPSWLCEDKRTYFEQCASNGGRPWGVEKWEREKGFYLDARDDASTLPTCLDKWQCPPLDTKLKGEVTAVDMQQRRLATDADLPLACFRRRTALWSPRALVRAETKLLRARPLGTVHDLLQPLSEAQVEQLRTTAWADVRVVFSAAQK